jgi:hypothetical protein
MSKKLSKKRIREIRQEVEAKMAPPEPRKTNPYKPYKEPQSNEWVHVWQGGAPQ